MKAAKSAPARHAPVIVLVEDDDGLRHALVKMLAVSGFRVLAFASAEHARDAAAWDHAACLVADIRLSGISGLDLIRSLRQSGRHMPAIVITAAPTAQVRNMAKNLGVRTFLEKPVRGNLLVAAIREAITP